MKNTTVRKLALGAAALLALATVLVMIFPQLQVSLGFTGATASAAPPGPSPTCGADIHYFAVDAPDGSHNFGPKQTFEDVPSGETRLGQKMHIDPLFAAAMIAFKTDGLNLSSAKVEDKGKAYAADCAAWKVDADAFMNSIKEAKVEKDPNAYATLGMVPSGTDQPKLIRSDQKVVAGMVLVITFKDLKDGEVRKLRIECDLQPLEDNFPFVPPATPPSPETTTVTTTSTTPPPPAPPTCPPDKPHGVFPVCKDDPSHDVQNNPGVPAGVKGSGSTPVGQNPGAASKPTDSATGCDGPCAASTSVASTTQSTLASDPPEVQHPEPIVSGNETSAAATSVQICDADGDGIPDDNC